jgi:hypothetical protein
MKKNVMGTIVALLMMPMMLFGQTYDGLWKQVKQAEEKDLPQTQLQTLQKIVDKAGKERAYGQLLKASLMQARVQATVSPDSLQSAVERLQQQAEATSDVPLQAVCYAVLAKIYRSNNDLSDDWQSVAGDYCRKALAHPAELAAVKTDGYEPFVVKGHDSRIYDDDLLSLIGMETRQYQAMAHYYQTTANRRAQLMSQLYALDEPDERESLAESKYIKQLDALAQHYADLPECGEVAIARYEFMNNQTDATAEQKVAYIDEALSRWGAWKTERMNMLRNARRELTACQFNVALPHGVWIPNREQYIVLNELRGIDQLTIKIYKVKVDGDTSLQPENQEDFKQLKPLLTPLPELTQTRAYSGKKDYELWNDTLQLQPLPVGVYMMEVQSQPQISVSRTLFFVSNVRVLQEDLPNHRIRFAVVNATTGQPLPGAQLRLTERRGNRKQNAITTLTTDKGGEYVYSYKDKRPTSVFATTADDRSCPEWSGYGYFSYYDNQHTQEHTAIYTDRAIYRPGQTVQVAAILYQTKNGFEHEALPGKTVTAQLRDANYKVVEERQLTADELGTVATQFTLPARGLTGQFCVRIGNETQYFRVEEYKRPTFQVEFPKVEQDYRDGDTLAVRATARSYAGVPVQGARVSYTVERRMAFWWMSYYRYWQGGFFGTAKQNETIFSGEAVTGEDGTFEVSMPLVLPKSLHPLFYNFVVVADVTDQAGETHQGQLSLPLGNRKTVVTADLSDKILAEQMPPLKLHVLNAAGNDVAATVRYQIDGGKWLSAQSNTAIAWPRLKSGKHQLKADYEGETLERDFVVFSLDDKRPAAETRDWFFLSDKQFPGDATPVTLQVGSSDDVHMVYTLVAGNDIIEQGSVDRKGELLNRKLTYKPEYGNGLSISFAWVRDGIVHHHEAQIQRPLPDKKLTMKWETFRDRLTPGQQEEWSLCIAAPNGDKLEKTALIAALYDKSLDQIAAHQWSLEPANWLPMTQLRWIYPDWGQSACYGYKDEDGLKWDDLKFSKFDDDCFPYPWLARRHRMMFRGMAMKNVAMADAAAPMAMEEAKEEIAVGYQKAIGSFDVQGNDEAEGAVATAADGGQSAEVQVRENLQETAFFCPQLVADEEGRVVLKFTLPESLTTWRFMGIAHTKDMMHGYIDGEAVAQKDVMIQPNVPRFFRVGDEGTLSARLFNTTDRLLDGTVRLQLLEPESMQPVLDEQMPCSLPANGTLSVSFRVDASKFEYLSLLVCRMTVSGETFSDGEQHYLPILPNRERVTVTVPFTQNGPGTKEISLERIFPHNSQLSPFTSKFTIEYTNNPAWLMIQTLPTIGNPCDKNAISQAASLYANTLGRLILAQNPQAKHVFEAWKRENAPLSSLNSQLQKDEELKDLLLSETPWVMDADRETEQRQRLADFFDENLMQQRLETATAQLRKLQNADGSWSWWEGMSGSFFMTVEISEMLVRLNSMVNGGRKAEDSAKYQGELANLSSFLDKAFLFMNKEIVELVAEMKKQEKKGIRQSFPTFKALQYLYLSTLDGRRQPANVQQAQAYLKNLLKKDVKHQTIYEKAMSAIVLNSPLYIKSLKEYTVYKEEMGRYYDTPRAGYSWRDYRIPTQVAAIEAISRLTPGDTQTIDEMRRWLLQEKRTQAWDTPLNSVDAIYAFLNGHSQALAAQPHSVLKIDGKVVDTSEATAGIGYVKTAQSYRGERTFTAEKTSTGTSWGAVYAQFMQHTSDIAVQKSGISVKREINVDRSSSGVQCKVGQRVRVRLTIEADRDYDFVEVVDRRAACMEPVQQLSGYRNGAYCSPKDHSTNYYFDILPKGKHVIETEYYMDRPGNYQTGTCTVQCAYAPEFRGTAPSQIIQVKEQE